VETETMTINELRDKKGNLANLADQILVKAREEGRELSNEEVAQFDAIHADIEKVNATIQRIERQEALSDGTGRRSEPEPGSRTRPNSNPSNPTSRGRVTQFDGIRAWMLPEDRRTDEMREAARRCGFSLGAKEINISLPSTPLKDVSSDGIREWRERNESRAAQGVGSGGIGGFTVADEAMQALETAMLEFGGMRSVATVIRTGTGGDLPIPTLNDTSNVGALLGENIAAGEQGLTFGQVVLQAFKYSSKYILVSVELLQDSSVNAPELIGRALGERIGRITNEHFTVGDGNSKPNGIVTASAQGAVGTTGQTTSVIYDDLVDLLHSVDPAYRNRARWMFNDATLKALKKIKVPQYSGDTAGVPLWQPGLVAGQPDTILGYSFTINQDMPVMASDAKSILFGDFSKYIVRDVRDITLVRLDERFAEYHQVGFLAFYRGDGDLIDAGTSPVKHYQNSNT
jgi:HK97 family phage major capsid protein